MGLVVEVLVGLRIASVGVADVRTALDLIVRPLARGHAVDALVVDEVDFGLAVLDAVLDARLDLVGLELADAHGSSPVVVVRN